MSDFFSTCNPVFTESWHWNQVLVVMFKEKSKKKTKFTLIFSADNITVSKMRYPLSSGASFKDSVFILAPVPF